MILFGEYRQSVKGLRNHNVPAYCRVFSHGSLSAGASKMFSREKYFECNNNSSYFVKKMVIFQRLHLAGEVANLRKPGYWWLASTKVVIHDDIAAIRRTQSAHNPLFCYIIYYLQQLRRDYLFNLVRRLWTIRLVLQ